MLNEPALNVIPVGNGSFIFTIPATFPVLEIVIVYSISSPSWTVVTLVAPSSSIIPYLPHTATLLALVVEIIGVAIVTSVGESGPFVILAVFVIVSSVLPSLIDNGVTLISILLEVLAGKLFTFHVTLFSSTLIVSPAITSP